MKIFLRVISNWRFNPSKLILISIIVNLICLTGISQLRVEVEITNNMSNSDNVFVSDLHRKLEKKFLSKREVKMTLHNPFTGSSEIIRAKKIPESATFDNLRFKDLSQLISEINKVSSKSSFFIYAENGVLPAGIPSDWIQCIDMDELKKEILVAAKKGFVAKVVYFKGFMPYIYSAERLNNAIDYLNSQGRIEELRVNFKNMFDGVQIRPVDSKFYKIEFDSIGYFDEYEVEITKGNGDKVLFREKMPFSDYDVSKEYFLYHTGEGRRCEIYLNEKMIGSRCVQTFPGMSVENVPLDKDCEDCQQECLYKRNFDIRIRGYSSGKTREELWSKKIRRFEFQCAKKIQ